MKATFIQRFSCYSYISSRISLSRLLPPPFLRYTIKTPTPTNSSSSQSHHGKAGDEETAIANENTQYIRAVNQIFNFSNEITKFNTAHELGFCANIVIPTKERALTTATNITHCNAGRRHRVFFVDGSTLMIPKLNTGPSATKNVTAIPSGAAVAYEPPTPKKNRHWIVKYFTPTCRDSVLTELAAIADGLAIAAAEWALYMDNNRKTSNGKGRWSKVTLFSDCTSALEKINKLRESAATDDRLLGQIVAVSRYFCVNEVQLELRWVPAHSSVEGNGRANAAARYAAKHQAVGMPLEEGLRWNMETSSNDMETSGSQ